MSLAYEHGVDDMFENFRAGETAFFGDMADQDHGHTTFFGIFQQSDRTLPDLAHAARCRFKGVGSYCLYRIDNEKSGVDRLYVVHDVFKRGLGDNETIVADATATVGTEFQLRRAFFARDVEHCA